MELACGHAQHVRHRPPWQSRPWTLSEAGRAEKLGQHVECPLCAMPALPAEARAYRRTATFDEATVPGALRRDHSTKPGVWGRIVVEQGELEYRLGAPSRVFVLTPERFGVIAPTELHQVRPLGRVRFVVEFLRVEGT
jgi:tellurite methyltransferase